MANELSVSHIDGLLQSGHEQQARRLSLSLLSALAIRNAGPDESIPARSQFIAIEENLDPDERDLDLLSKQYDLLFTDHLRSGDKVAAATALLYKAYSFRDWRCRDALEKMTSHFYESSDAEIQSVVLAGLHEHLTICPNDDPDFLPTLERYVALASRSGEAADETADVLIASEEALEGASAASWKDIAQRFLAEHGESVDVELTTALRNRIASRLIELAP